MFKRVLQSLTKTLTGKDEPKPGTWGASGSQTKPKAKSMGGSLLDKITATFAATAGKISPPPAVVVGKTRSPEDLCGIKPKMPKDEIKARLALLYRRYNRATSSLDAKLRAEAETMLDAIVAVREKTFGPI